MSLTLTLTQIFPWQFQPLFFEGGIFAFVLVAVFLGQWGCHYRYKKFRQWFQRALLWACVAALVAVGVDYAYQKNMGHLKDNTLNLVQAQSQRRHNQQSDRDKTSRQKIAQMVMRQAQKGLEKQGFVAIPSRYILLPIYNDAYTNQGLDAGADYANRSGVDPLGQQKPVMGQGNYGLAGHNFNDGKTGFSALQESNNRNAPYLKNGRLKGSSWLTGKSVILANATGLYEYEITGQTTVDKTDVNVLNPTDQPSLTIISCLFPSTQYRIVTHAVFKKHESWQAAPQKLIRMFNLRVQNTNAHVNWWNPGVEEGANGDAGGTKK